MTFAHFDHPPWTSGARTDSVECRTDRAPISPPDDKLNIDSLENSEIEKITTFETQPAAQPQSRASACKRRVAIFTLKNRTLNPIAGLFIDCVRAVAKSMSAQHERHLPGRRPHHMWLTPALGHPSKVCLGASPSYASARTGRHSVVSRCSQDRCAPSADPAEPGYLQGQFPLPTLCGPV